MAVNAGNDPFRGRRACLACWTDPISLTNALALSRVEFALIFAIKQWAGFASVRGIPGGAAVACTLVLVPRASVVAMLAGALLMGRLGLGSTVGESGLRRGRRTADRYRYRRLAGIIMANNDECTRCRRWGSSGNFGFAIESRPSDFADARNLCTIRSFIGTSQLPMQTTKWNCTEAARPPSSTIAR